MLDKNIPVTIGLKILDWDYLNTSLKKPSEILYTGNVKFVAYISQEFGYDTKDLVYDDRYSVKLPSKVTKEDFLKEVESLKRFYKSSVDCLQRINHGSYKVDKDELITQDKVFVEIVAKINQLYTRWPSMLAITSNFMNKDEDPKYTGSFLLSIYEKSKIGLYQGSVEKVKIKFNKNEFKNYEEFSEKMDVMCDRWDAFRRVSEKEKKEVYENISKSDLITN